MAQQRVSMASQLNGMGFIVTIANDSSDLGVALEDAQFMVANKPDEPEESGDSLAQFGGLFNSEETEDRDIDEWSEARDKKGEDKQWGFRRLAGRPPKGSKVEDIK